MQEPYLEVTFRHGRPLAAYYYLPRDPGVSVARSRPAALGLVVDYSVSGEPIGAEITSPRRVTLDVFNALLRELGMSSVAEAEFATLHAA